MQACGGTQDPLPPTDDSATSRLDAPAHHGLSPLQRYELPPGTSEEHGNVVLTCPAGGPGCVLRVAADGSVEYETAGGLPSIVPLMLTTEGIQDRLNELQRAASAPALVWRGAQVPRAPRPDLSGADHWLRGRTRPHPLRVPWTTWMPPASRWWNVAWGCR